MSLIGGQVATVGAGHHEVRVVRRDVAVDDAGDAAGAGQVVVPQPGPPRQQLLGRGVDQADAQPVLAGDLAAGVDDEQLAVVVRQLQLLHAEGAVDADATGDRVDEAGVDRAGRGVGRGQTGHVDAVDLGEPATDVEGGVGRRDGGHLVVGAPLKLKPATGAPVVRFRLATFCCATPLTELKLPPTNSLVPSGDASTSTGVPPLKVGRKVVSIRPVSRL